MSEEIIETNETNDVQKYIETINQMKANSVPRSDYDRVRDENKRLLEAMVNGNSIESPSTEGPAKPTIQELRTRAYGKDSDKLSDLEYVTTVLDLRDALLEETGIDNLIPQGKKYSPDYNDQYCAQKVYEGLRHCVDVAEGDNAVFIRELTRITSDTGMPNITKRIRR